MCAQIGTRKGRSRIRPGQDRRNARERWGGIGTSGRYAMRMRSEGGSRKTGGGIGPGWREGMRMSIEGGSGKRRRAIRSGEHMRRPRKARLASRS